MIKIQLETTAGIEVTGWIKTPTTEEFTKYEEMDKRERRKIEPPRSSVILEIGVTEFEFGIQDFASMMDALLGTDRGLLE